MNEVYCRGVRLLQGYTYIVTSATLNDPIWAEFHEFDPHNDVLTFKRNDHGEYVDEYIIYSNVLNIEPWPTSQDLS